MNCPNKEKWNLAIKKELQNIEELNVWTLRNKKEDDHPISSTWIFKEKTDDFGKVLEHKAHLLSSLCALLSFAAIYKYDFHQMDVRSAFLNAPLQEEICLEIPQGVSVNKETQVLQLNKALYGLKQASLAWNKINHLEDGFSLDQEHYIKELADKYEIKNLIPSNTPLKPNLQLLISSDKEHEEFNNLNINYRSAVGSLNYISCNTCPDITFAVSHLSQFLEKPGIPHWNACIQVLRYLYYSKTLCLTFKNHGFHHIKTYADTDWANNPNDRRSISGFTVGINQHLISWHSKRQQTGSHSKTEAEYKSLSDATKETTWLTNLINEIQLTTSPLDPLLLNDNKGAIDLALNDANHSSFKTKHMEIKFHYIRELLKKGVMLLKHVPTAAMNADFLTKSVGKTILLKSLNFYNLLKKTSAPSP
ncbi:hypothetical protein O181_076790 [Austropuccinia psidii MF-1]|uniref:Reverse transcriptase Ty1/copia-type domain-containing protein n=1 Tax=Austropuccinia psidii MF-1 TaxID=1389203 RepID=A0A9Q3F9H3_9BASI|nr:hypothetical protein [Austropuccinia psidii MF-1]